MKLMNSETHSCTVSLASLAILPLAGKAFFMMRLILAIGRYRSCSRTPLACGLCSPPLSWLPPAGLVGASAITPMIMICNTKTSKKKKKKNPRFHILIQTHTTTKPKYINTYILTHSYKKIKVKFDSRTL